MVNVTKGALSPSRGRARIGVVVPMSNTNLEQDMIMLRPEGVALHFQRAGGYDLDAVPDGEQMRQFSLSTLDAVLADLKAARPDIVLYGCTSATLAHGPEFDAEFTQQIADKSGAKALTAAGAIVEAARQLGVSKLAFASPYVQELNQECIDFLGKCDLHVVSSAYVGEDLGNYGQGELTPERIYEMGLEADSDEAEALLLSCTDMRAVEVVDALEEKLGKPVITSNQAMMWMAMRDLGIGSETAPSCGRLISAG